MVSWQRQNDYDANGFSGIFRTGQLAGQLGFLKRLPKLLASIHVKTPGLLIGLNVSISIHLTALNCPDSKRHMRFDLFRRPFNKPKAPYNWTVTGDSILEKL